jgi:hypothetical protein
MRSVIVSLAFAVSLAACGGPTINVEESMTRLRQAIATPVESSDQSADNSRLVQSMVEEHVFDDMMRDEVEAKIGRGDPCSRHPRCAEQGFEDDDWFYAVGQMGEASVGNVPILILGFDHTGRVVSTWNLTTH